MKREIATKIRMEDGIMLITVVICRIDFELSPRLVRIVAQGPDVSGIDKSSAIKLPKEEGTVFGIEVEFHVTGLVDEVNASVLTPV